MLHSYFYENPRPSFPDEIKVLKKLEYYAKKKLDLPDKKLKK